MKIKFWSPVELELPEKSKIRYQTGELSRYCRLKVSGRNTNLGQVLEKYNWPSTVNQVSSPVFNQKTCKVCKLRFTKLFRLIYSVFDVGRCDTVWCWKEWLSLMLEGVTQFDVGRNTQFDVGRNYSVWCWKELLSLMLERITQFDVGRNYSVWCWKVWLSLVLHELEDWVRLSVRRIARHFSLIRAKKREPTTSQKISHPHN